MSVMLVYCGQTWIKMKLDMKVGLGGPSQFVLDGDPAPPKKHSPQFSAHLCCGQMASWTKMPLVLDGDPAPSPKRGQSPKFSAHVYRGQTAAWIKMPLCTEVCLGPDDIVLDGDPVPLPKMGAEPPPQFSPNDLID